MCLGAEAQADGAKDLGIWHQRQLDKLCPDYEDLVLCRDCGTAYSVQQCSTLREQHPDGIARCVFIPIPHSAHPRCCGSILEYALIRRPHGRDETIYRPLATCKLFDFGLWFYRFASFHSSSSPLFTYLAQRPPPAGIMSDIFDGSRFAPFQEKWCIEPATQYFFLELAFDFASPFGKAPRSSQATKDKKVGLAHLIVLNLPPEQRTQAHSVCTALILDSEPTSTINGPLSFLCESLNRLYEDGMTVLTSDDQQFFCKFLLYVCTGDAPARAKCCGAPHHAGEWPCCTCHCHGDIIPIVEGAGNRPPRWSFPCMGQFPLRVHEEELEKLAVVASATSKTARNTATSKHARGTRWTPLWTLPGFQFPESIAIDYMHTWPERLLKTIIQRFIYLYGDDFVARGNTLSNQARRESGLPARLRNKIPSDILSHFNSAKAAEVCALAATQLIQFHKLSEFSFNHSNFIFPLSDC